MQPPEGPPVCTALILAPSGEPPPSSSTISLIVIPMGTSMSPLLRILPVSEKTLVPLLFSVPSPAYHSGPPLRIGTTLAKVSTLLIKVGYPQRPLSAGYGG